MHPAHFALAALAVLLSAAPARACRPAPDAWNVTSERHFAAADRVLIGSFAATEERPVLVYDSGNGRIVSDAPLAGRGTPLRLRRVTHRIRVRQWLKGEGPAEIVVREPEVRPPCGPFHRTRPPGFERRPGQGGDGTAYRIYLHREEDAMALHVVEQPAPRP